MAGPVVTPSVVAEAVESAAVVAETIESAAVVAEVVVTVGTERTFRIISDTVRGVCGYAVGAIGR